jgi:hypothetical protein
LYSGKILNTKKNLFFPPVHINSLQKKLHKRQSLHKNAELHKIVAQLTTHKLIVRCFYAITIVIRFHKKFSDTSLLDFLK